MLNTLDARERHLRELPLVLAERKELHRLISVLLITRVLFLRIGRWPHSPCHISTTAALHARLQQPTSV